MRVIYISQDGRAPSGITTYGHHLLEAWPEARLLLLNANEPAPSCPESIRARVVCVPEAESHDAGAVARWLGRVASEMGGTVTVLPNTGDTPWSATVEWVRSMAASERGRVRVLGIVHSDIETQYSCAARHALFAASWIGVSRRCVAVLRERVGAMCPRIHEMPYPVVVPGSATAIAREGPLRLAYIGRLEEPQKRVSRLVALFDALTARGVPFTARIAGDGPARDDLVRALQGSVAHRSIEILGALDRHRLDAVLAQSDVFVLTSAYEGLPLALLEAMAAGVCPVVMDIASGIGDVIEHGTSGFIVPQGDVDAMAEEIARLGACRDELARAGQAARTRVSGRFARDAHVARLGAIVAECRTVAAPDPTSVRSDPTATIVASLCQRARELNQPTVVFGAGMFGRKLLDACLAAGVRVIGLLDSDPARRDFVYRGLKCEGPEAVAAFAPALFLVGSIEFAAEIEQRIRTEAASAGIAVMPRIIRCFEASAR